MKIKVKLNRRTNVYITTVACATGLWLLAYRFGLSWEEVKDVFWMCIALLVVLLVVAVPAGFLLRLINNKRDL